MVELSAYGAELETMRLAGDQVSGRAGDVERLGDEVRGQHLPAQEGVAGLLEGPMRSAPVPVTLGAFAVMQATLLAGGAVRVFANAVSAYNTGVVQLRERWEGLSPEARQDRRGTFEADRQALEDELDVSANAVVSLLAGEITDGALRGLWNQGALPMGAERAFPGSDFLGQVDPDARWDAVSAEYFPEGVTVEAVQDLELDEQTAADLRVLLDVTETTNAEEMLLARLGEFDSGVVQDAMDETSDRDTLAAIAAGTTTLQYINGRTTARDPLNHQDRAYLLGWFALEPDQLFRDLPTTVETAIQHSMLGVPYADEDTYFSQTRDAYLRPVADAMLNLTNPDVGGFPMTMGGTLSTQQMSHIPGYLESNFLTDVRTLEIGVPSQLQPEVAEQRGYPHPLAEQGAGPTAVYVLGPPSDHHDADTTLDHVDAWRDDPNVAIPNLERLEGFAHLVEASTVEGGDAFMSNLADHADLVEQQLNELPESHEESLATTFRGLLGEDGEYMGLSPDELGDHFASEDRLVAEIEDQLEPLMGRGNDAVATIRAVVERNSP